MEIAGTAAAAITFGALILKLSKELYQSAKKIRYARREISKLVKEMGVFADLYEDFYRVCVSDRRKKGRNTFTTRRLIDWIEGAINAFKNLLDQVKALAGDSRYSVLETFTAHVKWFFSESEVKYLRCSLTVARENMRGFSNLTIIETINEEIELIKDVIAQGDRQAKQKLENKLGVTLEERLKELKETSRNRRVQKHAIIARMKDAANELERQSVKVPASPRIPKSKQLFRFANIVEEYTTEVREQCHSKTTSAIPIRQQTLRVGSVRATNSTASHSFVSKPSSYIEPVAVAPDSTVEQLTKALNGCGECTGDCKCSETESDSAALTRSSSPVREVPPRPAPFAHPSHRIDRSWQQPAGDNIVALSNEETTPSPSDEPRRRKAIDVESTQGLSQEGQESDDMEEVGEDSDEETQTSPFRPVAGVQGKRPPNWRNRHEKRESTGDHWHKKL